MQESKKSKAVAEQFQVTKLKEEPQKTGSLTRGYEEDMNLYGLSVPALAEALWEQCN